MLERLYIYFLIHFLKYFYGYGKIDTDLIYAQAYHETGNFKSDIFKEGNNLFGMRKPKIRPNKVSGENRGHGTFKSLFDSVCDYFMRQKYFKIPADDSRAFQIKTAQSGYATDESYLVKWDKIWKDESIRPISKTVMNIIAYGGLASLVLIIYLLYRKGHQSSGKRKVQLN